MLQSKELKVVIPRKGKEGGDVFEITKSLADFINEVPLFNLLKEVACIDRREDLDVRITEENGSFSRENYKRYDGEKLWEELGVHPNDTGVLPERRVKRILLDILFDKDLGVVVKDEPRYIVTVPNNTKNEDLVTVLKRVTYDDGEERVILKQVLVQDVKNNSDFHLTEEEILKDYKWAWDLGFAELIK